MPALITPEMFILVLVMAFFCEFIDSSLGMGYGTILSPTLIIMGFDPLLVLPSLLFSQALAGFSAAIFHHRFENVDFGLRTQDSKIVFIITSFGIVATILAALIAINISKEIIKTYIGALALIMGIILLLGIQFSFSWRKITVVGILSSFNKGISGGGFGPVVTSGQIISGQEHKSAVGVTTLAEAPICITGFLTYLLTNGLSDWGLLIALGIGAIAVTPLGAFTTMKIPTEKLKIVLGLLVITLGIWTLSKVLIL